MPGTRMEARRDIGPGENHECDTELDDHRDEEETREVDEADDINGKFCDDEQDPSDELEKCTGGQQSSESLL